MCTLATNTLVQVTDKKATTIDVQDPTVPCTIIKWSALHTSKSFQGLEQDEQDSTG
uniref:Uncharacterized protein n=1 Tax=Arundo donax TaxID=35708 RepID=A0A0A9FCX9_ARUDO